MNKTLKIGLVIGGVVVVGLLVYLWLANKDSYKYTNDEGHFSIVLPNEVTAEVTDGSKDNETDVLFSYGDEKYSLLVRFAEPRLDGKGGACAEENAKELIIAGQTVEACDGSNDSDSEAGYERYFDANLTNPNREMEYWVYMDWFMDKGSDEDMQFEALREAILNSLELN